MSKEAIVNKDARTKIVQDQHDAELATVNQQYEKIGKSIECGEYDAARMKASDMQASLGRLNDLANRLADMMD